jgi:hypothetical protein
MVFISSPPKIAETQYTGFQMEDNHYKRVFGPPKPRSGPLKKRDAEIIGAKVLPIG